MGLGDTTQAWKRECQEVIGNEEKALIQGQLTNGIKHTKGKYAQDKVKGFTVQS